MTRVGWRTVCCVSLEYLALGVWVGGLIVLVGAVIPAVFNTFGGQESGGLFLTKAFEAFFRLHKPIRSLYVVNVILGTWLLVLKAKRSWQEEGIPA